MATWNNRSINRALAPFNTKQRYKPQLIEFVNSYESKQKRIEDFLDEKVKEGT
jgi:hypothetical protein